MNKEAIIVGENYECRKTDFARPIIGEVVHKDDAGCVVNVERFSGLDADKIDAQNGQVAITYDEVAGIVTNNSYLR
ncbi:hypothetical protein [Enterococcus hermanniensis]|uniref:DUF2187 domain-containing protein n=1 Tax=Enterococcus hermanniensis TaxID=249189 RepID=A0A1L8TJ86_9ENTE|nr:hypothetical protein [Enterococcus hermanniensis]OJG44367.1 hypothetical protein RV04_GL000561 [Enterococcus hermanniensis]